jgi:hypothetical protein
MGEKDHFAFADERGKTGVKDHFTEPRRVHPFDYERRTQMFFEVFSVFFVSFVFLMVQSEYD